MTVVAEIIRLLQSMGRKPKKSRTGWLALCPAHDDHKPSLSVSVGDDGRVLLHCLAGCATRDVLKAMGLTFADLMPERAWGPERESEAIYPYHNETGEVLFEVVRFNDKSFAQRRPDGTWGIKGARRVLYRLPELTEDVGLDRRIYVLEGEKDCDRLRSEGLAATTNVGGAGKWRDEYSEALREARVCILPDNDDAGRKHAEQVAQALHGVAAEVKVLELPGLPKKGDVSDWLADDGTPGQLERLADETTVWEPQSESEESTDINPLAIPGVFHLTDAGNAERLVARHGQHIRHCHITGAWYVWNGQRWEPDATAMIRRLAFETVRHIYPEAAKVRHKEQRRQIAEFAFRSESTQKLNAMISIASTLEPVPVQLKELDCDAWLLNCLNGTIDLRTGKLREHRKEDLITKICPVRYDPDARFELWERFLETTTDGDVELQEFLQLAVGCSLPGEHTQEVLFFIYGPTASGKSTFAESLKATLRDYAVTADFSTFLRKRVSDGPTPDIARLAGSRLVFSVEVDEGTSLATGLVKLYTGGDTMTARFLYGRDFEFKQRGKLWLVANHTPKVNPDDDAAWRRILRIPFLHTVPEAGRDHSVKAVLTNPEFAGPAILAWAVQGCLDWQAAGKRLQVPSAVKASTEQYRREVDPLNDFIEDRCLVDPNNQALSEPFAVLWESYQRWADENGVKYPFKRAAFGKRLKAYELTQLQVGKARTRVYQGIALRTEVEG